MIVIDHRHLTVVAELGAGGLRAARHVTCTDPRLPADMAFKVPRPDLDAGVNHQGIARSPVDDGLVRLALMARLAYAVEVIHRPRGGLRLGLRRPDRPRPAPRRRSRVMPR